MNPKYTTKPGIWHTYIRKLLFVMRLTIVITILTVLQLQASNSAGQVITYKNNSVTLINLFKEIQMQTGYNMTWNENKIDLSVKVNVNFKNTPVKEALESSLKGLPLAYDVNVHNKSISIKYEEPSILDRIISHITAIDVRGRVLDENNLPLVGAVIKVKGTSRRVVTDKNGEFLLKSLDDKAVLVISFLGYETLEINGNDSSNSIKLVMSSDKLQEVEIVSTGYQDISKERATGSFTVIDNKLLNRAVSPDLITRLKGVVNGLLIDKSVIDGTNTLGINVRGRSTIFSNTTPLIVVDNFPFEGDINTLNPDMIENVTVLKDAAAASIWGVRAGNGVIVINTKKGKMNQKPVISLKSDLTIGEKPDLNYQKQLSSSEFIDVEQFLFDNGKYNATINNGYETISPIVAILQKIKSDPSSASQGKEQIDFLRSVDNRDQLSKYFYRASALQHYTADVQGGSSNQNYYFSAGYDNNRNNLVALSDSRITLKGSNTYNLVNSRLQLNTDVTFSKSKSNNDFSYDRTGYLPYEQYADNQGNPLPILFSGGLRELYTDTAGKGKLLDWKYRPLEELRKGYSNSKTDLVDYRLNLGLTYKLLNSLKFSVNYQYFSSNTKREGLDDKNSFNSRNLVNSFTQINGITGAIKQPFPQGSIYTPSFTSRQSNYGRTQLNFDNLFAQKHSISAIAGFEIRNDNSKLNNFSLYGYDPATATNVIVDQLTQFPLYYSGSFSTLGGRSIQNSSTNRYISFYGNASYTYDGRYIISGSYRKDESNLFGVKANQKGVPLWSSGFTWNLHKENFFELEWFSLMQLKATYGYNGNVNNSISAYLTASPSNTNTYTNTQFYEIINPPNDNLRWERVKNINLGLYFSSKNSRVNGSIEYFIKNGLDLIGSSPIAPQTGIILFTGNTADTKTSGFDIQINTTNIDRKIKWYSTLILNKVKDKITDYKVAIGTNSRVVSASPNSLAPIVGYPIRSIFSYKWAGLDAFGNPQGFLNNEKSLDYTLIRNLNDPSELKFSGSAMPTIFGSMRNTFAFKGLEMSFVINYKTGYFFRRQSLNYSSLLIGQSIAYMQADYGNRWQTSGDENKTNVPSLIYPTNTNRNDFYTFSETLIERADNIRLQDVQINYTLTKVQFPNLPFSSLSIYAYINNVGILWRANKYGIDPDVISGYPTPKTFAFGLKTNF